MKTTRTHLPPAKDPESAAEEGDLLVIGYGNTLRQDDGVGPYVAEHVAGLRLPGVRTLILAQLSPEHAEAVSLSRAVVFVDAVVEALADVDVRPIVPDASSQVTTHAVEPATLLALARDLFGRAPKAWSVTIRAEQMGFGEDLSPQARLGVEAAIGEIATLIRAHGHPRARVFFRGAQRRP